MTKKTMTKEEIKSALSFAKEVIAEYKEQGEPVPAFVYERVLELCETLVNLED